MADLSNYTPIYVRSNGNDTTGNGSLNSPYATPQKAFTVAYNGSGDKVLDIGVGNFGSIDLNEANANEWPARIAIRGVSFSQTFITSINGNGFNGVWDYDNNIEISPATDGKNITIISNNSIHIGQVICDGGAPADNENIPQGEGGDGGNGGSINLTSIKIDTISCNGANTYSHTGGSGGNITLSDISINNVSSSGGNSNYGTGGGVGGNGGNISLSSCNINTDVTSSGSSGDVGNTNGNGGNITIINSTARDIVSVTGENGEYGNAGNISIINSQVRNIISIAIRGDTRYYGGNGGDISVIDSITNSIQSSNSTGDYSSGSPGNVTLSGQSNMPNNIQAGSITTTNLKKGYGINKSKILGLI